MKVNEAIPLRRECSAVQIPSGEKVILPAKALVTVTQALGGTYTVITDKGYMVRISGKDADALGENVVAENLTKEQVVVDRYELEKLVWAQLKTIYDPEIPVNIVDLGLVYGCGVIPLPQNGNMVEVVMTLTAPGCGMGDILKADAEAKIKALPGVSEVNVEVVVEPPWNSSMMSEVARLELGM